MARSKVTGADKGIHKRKWIYYWIYPYVKFFFFHYYGKVEINGLENIPRGAPVIFAPNHQNALMDALIVLYATPGDMVFLARADIFNSRFLAYLLNSLKILPVFRQRDGAAELSKNQDIFDISVDVLKHRHYLCVMPEGNHGNQRKMRPLVKGIFRIAFKAQEDAKNQPFVKIVPVGLDFGDYEKQNSSLFINYGEPIEVSDYWEAYEENTARGINSIKARLAQDLQPLMIHIGTDAYYEMVQNLREIFNDRMREMMGIQGSQLSDRFRADKELIARIDALLETEKEAQEAAEGERKASDPGKFSELAEKVESYRKGVEDLGIRDWVVREKGYGMARTLWRYLSLVVTFPFFLYGFINNAIPYFLPVHFVRNIKDRQFHSSVKAGLGILILFPIMHGLQTLLVGIFTGPWWIWVIYMFSLFPMGKLALKWAFRWKKTVKGSWFRRQLRRKNADASKLVQQRDEILVLTEQLIGG